jgi:hypothetical protein
MSSFKPHTRLALGCAVAFAALTAGLGCKNTERSSPGAPPESSGTRRHDELFAQYSAMTAAERIQVAMKICYVGRDCDGAEATGLLGAAATPAEREALKATMRSTFLREYAAFLTEQGKRPDSVKSGGDAERTLQVSGDVCSRFLLEDFAGGPGKTAKLVGFTRFECESKALRAGVDL